MSAALTIAAGSITGCAGSAPTSPAGEPDEDAATSLLASVEGAWRADIASTENLSKGTDLRCYFVTDTSENALLVESTGSVTAAQIGCGPVRPLGAGDGEVWDTYAVVLTPNGDGTATFGEFDDDQSGQRLDGVAFWRPDGDEPSPDADKLAAPPPPPAESRLMEVLDAGRGQEVTTELRTVAGDPLITPLRSFRITGLARTQVARLADGPVRPASGEEFLVVRVETGGRYPYPEPAAFADRDVDASTQVVLAVNGDRRSIAELESDGAASLSEKTTERTLLLSVPRGSTPHLVARTAGREQALSLGDGRRTSTTAAGFYRKSPVVGVSTSLPATTREVGDYTTIRSNVRLEDAVLSAWDPQQGWAPEGKAWLQVTYEGELPSTVYGYDFRWATGSFTAMADGTKAPFAADAGSGAALVWQVPASTRKVDIALTPTLDLRATSDVIEPARATVRLGQVRFSVTFP
ncbi:MAG: hypothetical protein ACRCYX_01435 [Dermatophilaceae bacterium]